MVRKVFFLFLLPLAVAVTFYACKCTKELGDYMRPVNLWVEPGDNQTTGYYRFTGDTLRFNAYLNVQCIAQYSKGVNPFVTEIMATKPLSCPCGEQGFKPGITGFSVTTVGAYNTFADGEDVSALFAGYTETYNSQSGQAEYAYYPLSLVQQQFEKVAFYAERYSGAQLFLTQKPGDTLSHQFKYTLTTADTTITYTGDSFKWM